ncbi:MAG: hypothetical protein CMD33_06085 [Flavobacteriales bacterium]|nr:hypothetical protein [Flavobacteriales bacterium]
MAKIRLLFGTGIVAWFAIKLYGLGTWTWEQSNQAGIFWNLACVTGVAALAALAHRNKTVFIERWKSVAKTTVLYSVLLTCSMGIWYYGMVPETLNQRKEEQLNLLKEFVNDPTELAELQNTNAALDPQSIDVIYAQQAANIEVFFSPLFFLGTVLLIWIFVAVILSAVFAAIMPRIWDGPLR